MTRESTIERYLREQVEKLGGLCIKLSPTGLRGLPDRLIVLPNVPICFAETKAPRGSLSARQVRMRQVLENLGQDVYTIYNKEHVDEFIEEQITALLLSMGSRPLDS